VSREAGNIPIMLKSNRCHLERCSPLGMVEHKEESEELGGYFVVNGIEKLVRLLVVQRRNHVMALTRPSFVRRGALYSQYGVQIRCVRADQSSQTNVLHYLNDGNVMFRFSWRKNEYLVPVVMLLKSLLETNDKEIFDGIVGAEVANTFLTERLELLLRTYKAYGLTTKQKTLAYLGSKFKVVMNVSEDLPDIEVGKEFLRKVVLIHLKNGLEKSNLLMFMVRKLYAVIAGDCAVDNPDSTQHQEVLLGGFLYGMILKERIEEYLLSVRTQIQQDIRRKRPATDFNSHLYLTSVFQRIFENIGKKMQYFLSTGNLVSQSGLDLQQTSGYTIVAEKINFYRFISHFRMVHRGSFFAELKTTTVRKLLPESWGFLCPVHTPDGAPCGLLNHLAHKCQITTTALDTSVIPALLITLGITPVSSATTLPDRMCVQLDGRVIGWSTPKTCKIAANTLRYWKVEGSHHVPLALEIGFVPQSKGGQYPGLYLFSSQARMIRPVEYLPLGKEDFVGPFEQVYMDIACTADEIISGTTTHLEFSPTNILSMVANLTPFSDFNQSPRNMYQCQMGKQTMGTPGTALSHRTDNKIYRIQTPQTPIVRPKLHNAFGIDDFPMGMNAVVAVISYTGYDMDDAMILNKSAHERGFGYGTIYKTEKIDLDSKRKRGEALILHFGFGKEENFSQRWLQKLDSDGLPMIGVMLEDGDPLAAYYDDITGKTDVIKYKGGETAFVEEVRLLGTDAGDTELQILSIKYRIPRSPVIGDKFSSRHGQKGVCSQKWPAVDMPFSESGMQPDIIINPHAFPSRMTIGMFVESLAGKAGALHGMAQDGTPWTFSEDDTAADYFGYQLAQAGFNFHGNEPMYSGITGEEFKVDIYIGMVYYQRLRHMVNDKFQVRTTGPVHDLTMQPVKGRKRGGGIRIGEMERDALLAHGASYLLQDRLLNCSDYHQTSMCRDCGSMTAVSSSVPSIGTPVVKRCRRCARQVTGFADNTWQDGQGQRFAGGENIAQVAIPYVLRYLETELAAMGIRLTFNVNNAFLKN